MRATWTPKIPKPPADKGWRKWFAWYPVRLQPGLWVWLETLERRYTYDLWWNRWVAEYRERG